MYSTGRKKSQGKENRCSKCVEISELVIVYLSVHDSVSQVS